MTDCLNAHPFTFPHHTEHLPKVTRQEVKNEGQEKVGAVPGREASWSVLFFWWEKLEVG